MLGLLSRRSDGLSLQRSIGFSGAKVLTSSVVRWSVCRGQCWCCALWVETERQRSEEKLTGCSHATRISGILGSRAQRSLLKNSVTAKSLTIFFSSTQRGLIHHQARSVYRAEWYCCWKLYMVSGGLGQTFARFSTACCLTDIDKE